MPIIRASDRNRNEAISAGLESFSIVDAARGGDTLRVGELTIAPVTGWPRHAHTNTEEAIGNGRVLVEGGEYLGIPAGGPFLKRGTQQTGSGSVAGDVDMERVGLIFSWPSVPWRAGGTGAARRWFAGA